MANNLFLTNWKSSTFFLRLFYLQWVENRSLPLDGDDQHGIDRTRYCHVLQVFILYLLLLFLLSCAATILLLFFSCAASIHLIFVLISYRIEPWLNSQCLLHLEIYSLLTWEILQSWFFRNWQIDLVNVALPLCLVFRWLKFGDLKNFFDPALGFRSWQIQFSNVGRYIWHL